MNVGVAPCSVLIESRTCLCSDSAGVVRMRAPGCVIITSSAAGHSGVCVRVCVCDILSCCCYCCWITDRGCEETQAGEESTRPEPKRSRPPGARRSGNGECVGGGEAHRSGSVWRTDKEVEQNALVLKKNAAIGSVLPLLPALPGVTVSPSHCFGCWFYR